MDGEAGVSQALFDDVTPQFPNHFNFPIRSKCVLKAIIQRKKQWIVLQLLDSFFFRDDAFYDIVPNTKMVFD